MAPDTQQIEARLRERKTELEHRLHNIEGELDKPRDNDFTEMVTERENDEVLEEIGSTGLDELRQINAALVRISQQRYGICTECGENIPAARLEIIPYASTCTSCSD